MKQSTPQISPEMRDLLSRLERLLAVINRAESWVGKELFNDEKLLLQIREGRRPRPDKVARIEKFIREQWRFVAEMAPPRTVRKRSVGRIGQ